MSGEISEHPSNTNPNDTVVLQFFGDISLNGLFCDPQNHDAVKRNMKELAEGLGQCDLRIGNWESPLWGEGKPNPLKPNRLCTTPDAAKSILPLGLNVALLANNHIFDYAEKGFEKTVSFLKNNNITYLGAGTSEKEAEKPLVLTLKSGFNLGLLNYIDPQFANPNLPPQANVYLNILDNKDLLLARVSDLAAHVDAVVLNLHWGIEYLRYPSLEQLYLARHAVEAGARIVACHHPHCLQGYERFKQGCIFYSLGNFLFAGLKGRETLQWPKNSRRTAVATCAISKSDVERVHLTHLYQSGLILKWDDTPSRKKKQNRLNQPLELPDAKYRRLWRRETFWQWLVIAPFRFIKNSGGLRKALSRITWQHITAVYSVLRKKS